MTKGEGVKAQEFKVVKADGRDCAAYKDTAFGAPTCQWPFCECPDMAEIRIIERAKLMDAKETYPTPWRRDASKEPVRFRATNNAVIAVADSGTPNDALWSYIVSSYADEAANAALERAATELDRHKERNRKKAHEYSAEGNAVARDKHVGLWTGYEMAAECVRALKTGGNNG